MKSVIQNHNANLLSNHTTPVTARSCSCRRKSECLLNNECLSESLVYKAAFFHKLPHKETNIIMELVKRLPKNGKTIILLHLGIKANRKVCNSPSTSGN